MGTPLPAGSFLALDEPDLRFLRCLRLPVRLGCLACLEELDRDWPWLEGVCGDDEVGCGVVLVLVVLGLSGTLECEGEVEVELDVVVEDELVEVLDDEDVVAEVNVVAELEAVGGLVVVVVMVVVVVVLLLLLDDGVVWLVQVIVSETTSERCRSGFKRCRSGITPGVASIGTC